MNAVLDPPEAGLQIVIIHRPRKSIGLRFTNDRLEVIVAPDVPVATLQRVLERKRQWIRQHWQRIQLARQQHGQLPAVLQLQDERWAIQHQPDGLPALQVTPGGLLVTGARPAVQALLAGFVRQAAVRQLPMRLALQETRAVRLPAAIKLSSARTRWGSCTRSGIIRLNWRLVLAPGPVLDYVIAHELAHLHQMNHSAAFWAETERLCPGWQAARSWLRQQGESLFVFG